MRRVKTPELVPGNFYWDCGHEDKTSKDIPWAEELQFVGKNEHNLYFRKKSPEAETCYETEIVEGEEVIPFSIFAEGFFFWEDDK